MTHNLENIEEKVAYVVNVDKATKAKGTKDLTATKHLIGIVSGKGGVGKTMTARVLLDVLRGEGVAVGAYDGDGSVGGLVRLYGTRDDDGGVIEIQDPLQGVAFYDLRSDRERNTLLDSIALDVEVILHDLPGGSTMDIQRIVDGGDGVEGLLDTLDAHNTRLTLLHVVDNEIESAQSVGEHLKLFGDRVDHVAVLNMRECRGLGDFPYWAGFEVDGVKRYGKAREKMLAMGGKEIQLPALPPSTRAKINAERMTFSKAKLSTSLTITEKAHVSKLLRDFSANLGPARAFFGLSA
jgi:hypothetical protein